ncbi:cytochrome P450 [Mycolicibacter sinensis]|uniref:cytochrome P450 n=1 Tax=Mycolicibacter sinensis (strain JDM601) TaxID=875328 RepID=UPI0009EF134D|nr:cytochrome P450 [Mycolicibacter sinensis]
MTISNARDGSKDTTPDAHNVPVATTERPPGPSGVDALTLWIRIARDLFAPWRELATKYGDVVNIPLPFPGLTVTLVSHPDHVEHIMTRHHDRYTKVAMARELVAGEPPALPLLEGDEWRRVRRAFNPHFGEAALANVSDQMIAAVTEQVDAWRTYADDHRMVNLEHEFGRVVMAGLLRAMFHQNPDTDTLDRWVSATLEYGQYVVARMATHPLPEWIPRPRSRTGKAAQGFLLRQLDAMIAQRLANPRDGDQDLLDVALSMPFDGTPQHQYGRMRSELLGLVFAGHDTTAEALTWTIALLCRNPEALANAYAEVDALDGVPLEYAHVAQLPYLRACFDEAQRIQAAPMNWRTTQADDVIGGYFIPKGSHVVISPYALHRDRRFWRDPETFQPSRFLTDKIDKNAFIPFNTGPRKCMGSRMAYIQGIITLATVLQRYRFRIKEGWTPKHELHVSIGLAGGLPMRVYTR